jgi:hypothetical protein
LPVRTITKTIFSLRTAFAGTRTEKPKYNYSRVTAAASQAYKPDDHLFRNMWRAINKKKQRTSKLIQYLDGRKKETVK